MKNKKWQGAWEQPLMEGKNPIHTGAFLNALDQRDFTQDEVTAREGGQNAIDAGRSVKGITQLHFLKFQVKGKQKKQFLDLFGFEDMLRPRVAIFNEDQRNKRFSSKLSEFLDGNQMTALLIRDFNTCGLGGQWDRYERGDHFGRLVCALNLDDKADGDSSSGGSFGLGKTTYAKSSLINTVVYHSVFEKTSVTKQANRRLMATGVYPRHKMSGKEYGGFAYYGAKNEERDGESKPFENEEASQIWGQVGDMFNTDLSRTDEEHGTDILILMDGLDIQALRKAIEDYYFPAIMKSELTVTFQNEDGVKSAPAVLERDDLDQFIKLFKKAERGDKDKGEKNEAGQLNKTQDKNMGSFAFESADPGEAGSSKNNCVALMRGTGMVLNYVKMGSDQYEPAIGVFVAHQNIWPYLVASENAAHSEWNSNQRRLDEDFPKIGPQIVKGVNDRLQTRFSAFQKNLQPDISITRSESGLLARLLSGALAGNNGDKGPTKDFHNPVSVHLTQKAREDAQSIWKLQIHENEHTPEKKFELRLYLSVSISGDSKRIPIRHMEFKIKDKKGRVLKNEAKPELKYQFSKGEQLDLIVELNNPGRHNFVVQCKCVAEIERDSE